jgi:hypothetical protein
MDPPPFRDTPRGGVESGATTFPLLRGWRGAFHIVVVLAASATGPLATVLPRLLIPLSLITGAYGLARLYEGLPRALRVTSDVVELRRWLRPKVTFPRATTRLQLLPDEIVFIADGATHAVPRRAFSERDYAACVTLLGRVDEIHRARLRG